MVPQSKALPVALKLLLTTHLQQHSAMPMLEFAIKGVTFEGRQPRIQQLLPHQHLQLVPEPNNAYDPNAIAIRTLQGDMLGYVPRGLTHLLQGQQIALVRSTGPTQAAPHIWGARVWALIADDHPPIEDEDMDDQDVFILPADWPIQ